MGWVVAFAGRKGGTGKTTVATAFAVAAAEDGATVTIGDFDDRQRSSASWGERRAANGLKPRVQVQVMANEKAVKLARELVDLLVLDLPGAADGLTLGVAQESDLVVVVTDTNALELEPTVNLLRALERDGLKAPRVVVALTKVLDDKRAGEAREYLKKAGFEALPQYLPHNRFVHDIGNDGRAAVEIPNTLAAKQVRAFVQGLIDAFGRATEHLRGNTRDPGPTRGRDKGGRER